MKKFFGLVLIAATVVAASVYVNAEGLNFEVCHGNYSGTDLPYRKAVCNSDGDGKRQRQADGRKGYRLHSKLHCQTSQEGGLCSAAMPCRQIVGRTDAECA